MNLQTLIRTDLWLAISNTYLAENYSHAILDSMHHLSNLLRDKTGVDGDGASLVGQALGGDSPRLRLNKLQTETERNIQKGMEQILRGLYLSIRNPRSHEQIEDSKDTADPVILFINFVLNIIDSSEEPFTLQKFLTRVFDSDFVSNDRYAELLAEEIPLNKHVDTLIEIYRKRLDGDGEKLTYIVRAIYAKLSDQNIMRFLAVVSDDLKTIQDEKSIRLTLQILPPIVWPKISEVARLRIENKLIGSIGDGQAYQVSSTITGALGTWAIDYVEHFTLKDELGSVMIKKLEDSDADDRRYIAKYFMNALPKAIIGNSQIRRCIQAISKAIRKDDYDISCALLNCMNTYPENWQRGLVENLKDLTDQNSPAIYLRDGTSFLRSQYWGEEDIPF